MKKSLIALSSVLAFSVAVGAVPLSDYTTPQTVLAAPYQVATSSETITADGYGRYPAGMPASIAKIQARRAAVVDAQRNLLESIKGVAIDSETTVENFMLKNDVIHSKVSGIIKGAQVISEEALPDGYKVTVAIPVYGVDSVSDVAITAVVGDKAPVPVPQPSPNYKPSVAISGGYSGLVINAKGKELVRTFCPAIYDTTGRAIYGVYNVDKKYAIDYGVVGYAKGPEGWGKVKAGTSRAGTNPLVINAVSVRERTVNKCDVVVSVEDADRILAENARSHFLDKYAVMFEI